MNHDEVRHWFELASDLPCSERGQVLESLCADAEVRAEVLALLEYDHPENSLVAAPVTRVGPYELGPLLGSGGMGAVYEARRTDGQVDQRVAVKFARVPPGASSTAVLRRFARERQTLATLRHPYIAGLIDAGTATDGAPYAVLEQVDGLPVDAYCDSHVPSTAGRIRLFLKLCEAVQFAHRNLIVHSDIKPANVLVTSDGIPKLIDFGIASDIGSDATRTQPPAFTLEYASPEQLLGLKVTVLTDVYGLGAVLYRLLTGAKLRDVEGVSVSEIFRSARHEDLRRPSVLNPELKGDLENILLKALQTEPQQRYGSVPEFVDDLNRYLAGLPVKASPDSMLYRAGRFARRHWFVLALSASFSVALAATAVIAGIERRNALESAADTRRLANRLLFEIPDGGSVRVREKLSALALDYLQTLERGEDRDPALRWELMNAYTRLASDRGGGASSVGDAETATRLSAKALELGAKVEQSSPDRERLGKVFDLYEQLAGISQESGNSAQHRTTVDRMLRLAPRLDSVRHARALLLLARYLDDHGPETEAVAAYASALTILRSLAADPATEPKLISSLVGFGRAQALTGNFDGAIASLREAIARSGARIAAGGTSRQLYWSYIALGDVLGNPGRFSLERPEQAAAEYRKARAVATQLVDADPANEIARMDLARAYNREAAVLALSRPGEALVLLDRFHTIVARGRPGGPAATEARLAYLTDSVAPLIRTGRHQRAQAYLVEARQLLAGVPAASAPRSRNSVLRAEALLFYHSQQGRAALELAQQMLAALPAATNPVLSGNFEKIQLLERIREWAPGVDPAAHAAATRQLNRIWRELEAANPGSTFIQARARSER